MNDAQLRRMLNERSPWRSRQVWEADDPDLRAANRLPLAYEPEPLRDIRVPGLYVLRGPRRVGKSLEMKRAISRLVHSGASGRAIFFASCDGLSKQDLRRLIVQGHNVSRTLPGPLYWFIDEVTSVSGWSEIVKDLRDQNTAFRESCVVLTGSSAQDLEAARSDLADRRGGIADSDRLLLPMGFRTFCRSLGGFDELPDITIRPADFLERSAEQAIWELEPWSDALDNAWGLYLEIGGFPRAVGEFVGDGAVSDGFVRGLWDVVVGELNRNTRISEAETAAFFGRLAENLCSPINASRVATDVGLYDNHTVQARIDDLVRSFLTWRCHRINPSGLPNPAAQRKLYFVDPIVAQLAHRRNPRFLAPDASRLNEQQIGLALNRAAAFTAPEAFVSASEVMYERTKSSEIDFVGPTLAVPFECKYTDGNWRRETQGMSTRYGQGVIATRSPLAVGSDEKVWAIPASIVAWLLEN